jgi:hypothetical protein
MGLILDSSVLITAERQGRNARQMLTAIAQTAGNTDIAVSVVTLIELAHGAARADTAPRKALGGCHARIPNSVSHLINLHSLFAFSFPFWLSMDQHAVACWQKLVH